MPTHAERRVLPYTPQQMFDLVAAIDRYPEFLPWCVAARVTRREGDVVWADMVVGFRLFRERFASRVTIDRPGLTIDVAYDHGPLRHLDNRWRFEPHGEGQCLVDFRVDFSFRSRLLQMAVEALFNEAVRRMVGAFEGRAHALYGPRPAPPLS
jgi:coenzyme Q-binding protein COQ10